MSALEQRYQAFRSTKFFGSLDGLRALSIFMVIWHHVAARSTGVLSKGYLGVSLFFVVSGFLITTLLLREREQTGTLSLKAFYVRRTLRIFPLYYAVIALYTVLVFVTEKGSEPGKGFIGNLPYFLSYTSNWFVTEPAGTRVIFFFAWSLATEEQFYLLWPSLVKYLKGFYTPAVFMAGLMLADLGLEYAVAHGSLDGTQLWVRIATSITTPICLGCLGAFLLYTRRGFEAAWPVLGTAPAAVLALCATVASLVLDAPLTVVFVAMTWLVLAVCIREDHLLARVLGNRPMRYVGSISYGIYLLHMLAVNAARKLVHGGGEVVIFLLGGAIAIVLASWSFRFFERPFLKLKDRFGRPPKAPHAAANG